MFQNILPIAKYFENIFKIFIKTKENTFCDAAGFC